VDEAAAASYELSDVQYAANEVEATWVTALLGTLVGCLQWLQPMLTPGNFDALVASLLDKARAPARCPSVRFPQQPTQLVCSACTPRLRPSPRAASRRRRPAATGTAARRPHARRPEPWLRMGAVRQVVDRIEALMRLKRFNQLGGLQLERDVRLLTSVLGEATGRPVRDKFARLAQMGTLLGLESVAELLEFWRDHAGGAGWRLGEEQVREVLGQRPDFAPQDIHALDLSL